MWAPVANVWTATGNMGAGGRNDGPTRMAGKWEEEMVSLGGWTDQFVLNAGRKSEVELLAEMRSERQTEEDNPKETLK